MSDGGTLFGILLISVLVFFIASDILLTSGVQQCVLNVDITTMNTATTLTYIFTNPCMAKYGWFTLIFGMPMLIVGGFIIAAYINPIK